MPLTEEAASTSNIEPIGSRGCVADVTWSEPASVALPVTASQSYVVPRPVPSTSRLRVPEEVCASDELIANLPGEKPGAMTPELTTEAAVIVPPPRSVPPAMVTSAADVMAPPACTDKEPRISTDCATSLCACPV